VPTPSAAIEILVVEDSEADARLTMEALRDPRIPYHVQLAGDGEEALKFLHHEPPYRDSPRPAMILLDLNLPKVDGITVLTEVKSDPELKEIPVVVFSGSSSPDDVEQAYRHQAALYITKPVEVDKYFAAIRSLKEMCFTVATLPANGEAVGADGESRRDSDGSELTQAAVKTTSN
jgi:CheY-like chemotaxis protein